MNIPRKKLTSHEVTPRDLGLDYAEAFHLIRSMWRWLVLGALIGCIAGVFLVIASPIKNEIKIKLQFPFINTNSTNVFNPTILNDFSYEMIDFFNIKNAERLGADLRNSCGIDMARTPLNLRPFTLKARMLGLDTISLEVKVSPSIDTSACANHLIKEITKLTQSKIKRQIFDLEKEISLDKIALQKINEFTLKNSQNSNASLIQAFLLPSLINYQSNLRTKEFNKEVLLSSPFTVTQIEFIPESTYLKSLIIWLACILSGLVTGGLIKATLKNYRLKNTGVDDISQ